MEWDDNWITAQESRTCDLKCSDFFLKWKGGKEGKKQEQCGPAVFFAYSCDSMWKLLC